MKKLQNHFTTPEQSKRLLELGVPKDSADFYYDRDEVEIDELVHPYILPSNTTFTRYDDRFYLPCWSVGRLIEIFDICYNGEYHDSLILSMWMDIDSIILALSDKECIDFSKLEG